MAGFGERQNVTVYAPGPRGDDDPVTGMVLEELERIDPELGVEQDLDTVDDGDIGCAAEHVAQDIHYRHRPLARRDIEQRGRQIRPKLKNGEPLGSREASQQSGLARSVSTDNQDETRVPGLCFDGKLSESIDRWLHDDRLSGPYATQTPGNLQTLGHLPRMGLGYCNSFSRNEKATGHWRIEWQARAGG